MTATHQFPGGKKDETFRMIRAIYTEEGYSGGCYVDPGEDDPVGWMTPHQLFDYAIRVGGGQICFERHIVPPTFTFVIPDSFITKPLESGNIAGKIGDARFQFVGDSKPTVDGDSILFSLRDFPGTVRVPGRDDQEIGVGEDLLLKQASYRTNRNKIGDREVWTVNGILAPTVSEVKQEDLDEFMGMNLWFTETQKKVAGRFLIGFGGDLVSGLHDSFPEGKHKREEDEQ